MEVAQEHGWTSDADQITFDEAIFTEARKRVVAHHQVCSMASLLFGACNVFKSVCIVNYYTPSNEVRGVYWNHPVCPSVRLSVCLSVDARAPLGKMVSGT